jgi:aspartate/methionine/tyrosine aminotransferase
MPNSIFAALPTTVFEVMSQLARAHDAVNLGQGFPDDAGPLDVREKAAEAVIHGSNQYPPMLGVPALRAAVAAHYKEWQNVDYDAATEVMVTSGATEALAGALLGLIEPGDEVVLFEPMYDAYLPLVRRASGIPRFVTLQPPAFGLTEAALEAAFAPNAAGTVPKLVVFNNPQNPAARVYGAGDLALLAKHCVAANAVVVCDEVWEHVVFDGARHVPLASLPGMRERTVKIGSAGKIFSLTGWKVGFVCAPPDLLRGIAKAHQFLTFTTPPNLQTAVAFGLGKPRSAFDAMCTDLQASRDYLQDGLARLGFTLLPSQGTYFVNLDVSAYGKTDVDFCQWLVREHRVASIPVSAFYAQEPVTSVVRLCFAKRQATLDLALERLAVAKSVLR